MFIFTCRYFSTIDNMFFFFFCFFYFHRNTNSLTNLINSSTSLISNRINSSISSRTTSLTTSLKEKTLPKKKSNKICPKSQVSLREKLMTTALRETEWKPYRTQTKRISKEQYILFREKLSFFAEFDEVLIRYHAEKPVIEEWNMGSRRNHASHICMSL